MASSCAGRAAKAIVHTVYIKVVLQNKTFGGVNLG
jgi:hypothetical protein